jgi:hypothetical protein
MATPKQIPVAHRDRDTQSRFADSYNIALMLTLAAMALPVLYFSCIYILAR